MVHEQEYSVDTIRRSTTGKPDDVLKKIMVANRGEIAIRVFRSAHELSMKTVALFSHEDRLSMHRYKVNESSTAKKECPCVAVWGSETGQREEGCLQ